MLVNPPYDGKPCVGCSRTLDGGTYALMFNAMNRLGEPKMMEKIWDLRAGHSAIPAPDMDEPVLQRFYEAHRRLLEASQGMVLDGMTIRWLPGVMQAVTRVMDEVVRPVLVELDPLLDAHREDRRHCDRGGYNVLRESRGSKHDLWGAREGTGSYDHFVMPLAETLERGGRLLPGDIQHTRCRSWYRIDKHFHDHLAADPNYYAEFFCSTCRANCDWSETKLWDEATH